jgi:cytidine deaminase
MLITEARKLELVQRAVEARRHAYAPYSSYPVGAALLTGTGKVFTGANVENAAYPTGMCAERTALFHAVSEGERVFAAIAVVTENAGTPCGSCRQALSEFGLDTIVLIAQASGRIASETTVGELLPQAFSAGDLHPV